MNILAFESSCDETSAAVVRDGRTVLSDAILSQADMHALYGGVVPEIASRKHVEAIAGLTDQALRDAGLTRKDIDAVAVTYAPGLIGAVLVGVSFAKSAAYALGVPLIPVHHVRGHIAANYLAFPELEPPGRRGGGVLRQGRPGAGPAVPRRKAHGPAGRPVPRREIRPAPGPCGGRASGHELFGAENRCGKSGPQRPAEGGASGRRRPGP